MSQTSRVSGRATSVFKDTDGATCVKYHNTTVFKLSPTGNSVTLNTGGWRTATTKLRMNQALNQFGIPLSVYQKDGQWYVLNQKTGDAAVYANNVFVAAIPR